ncbi:unnamed protein product [Echinostoma caproni]|uniref:Fe-S hydro-lyase tartrate dehydratase beta-type catalytic domain-containing protein n=1 Tax=Echinostoma caproni TaxID=27848 RepID=A0A3P8G2A3_9TREM|nr:unnamed protein product [Echinostoma caproni]
MSASEFSGVEQNHQIAPLNSPIANWTQTELVTTIYCPNTHEMDEIPTTHTIACTWDSVVKLIEVAFSMSQYDVFIALLVPTMKLLQDFLTSNTEQTGNAEMAKSNFKLLNLMRALYTYQRQQRASLSAREAQNPALKQIIGDDSLSVRSRNPGLILDCLWHLWDYGKTAFTKLLPVFSSIKNDGSASFWRNQLIAHVYLFRVIQSAFVWLQSSVHDGMLVVYWGAQFLTAVNQLYDYQIQELSSGQGDLETSRLLLAALNMEESAMSDATDECYVSLWISIWARVGTMQRWIRRVISSRMDQLAMKLFNEHHPESEAEYRELSELIVESLWSEEMVAFNQFALESQMLHDTAKETMKQELTRSLEKLFSKSVGLCRRNWVAKAFFYCQLALHEQNSDKATNFLQMAEELLLKPVTCPVECANTSLHQTMLPQKVRIERELPKSQEDRCPPPLVISRSGRSVTLETRRWTPKSGQNMCIQGRCVIRIDNLRPDELYVFAVAAYDAQGRPLGSHQNGLGQSTEPVLTCSEWDELMPLTYLVESAYKRNMVNIGDNAFHVLWSRFVMESVPVRPQYGPDASPLTPLNIYKLRIMEAPGYTQILKSRMALCVILHAKHSSISLHKLTLSCNDKMSAEGQRARIQLANRLIIGMQIAAMAGKADLFVKAASLLDEQLAPMIQENVASPELAQVMMEYMVVLALRNNLQMLPTIMGRITDRGVFLEQLETDPSKYLPDPSERHLSGSVVKVNLNRPMDQVLAELSKHPIRTRLSLTGTLVVARDIAHAKIKFSWDSQTRSFKFSIPFQIAP